MKIQNHGKFHFYSICDCQVVNFPMFLWRCSIHEMGHFWEFLSLNSPKYRQIFAKFLPEVVFKETQTVFQEFRKNSNFCGNGRHPKFVPLIRLWPPFSLVVSPLPFQWKIATSKARASISFSNPFLFQLFFTRVFLLINENASFQHVAFLNLIRYRNLLCKCLN